MSNHIVNISYDIGGVLRVRLDDNRDFEAVDVVNQLAVDAAFERRAGVTPEPDGGGYIVRVQSDQAPPGNGPGSPPPPDSVVITGISTQIQQGGHVTEILYAESPSGEEKFAKTYDPVIHLLCHGAYLSQHALVLKLDDDNFITSVTKKTRPL